MAFPILGFAKKYPVISIIIVIFLFLSIAGGASTKLYIDKLKDQLNQKQTEIQKLKDSKAELEKEKEELESKIKIHEKKIKEKESSIKVKEDRFKNIKIPESDQEILNRLDAIGYEVKNE